MALKATSCGSLLSHQRAVVCSAREDPLGIRVLLYDSYDGSSQHGISWAVHNLGLFSLPSALRSLTSTRKRLVPCADAKLVVLKPRSPVPCYPRLVPSFPSRRCTRVQASTETLQPSSPFLEEVSQGRLTLLLESTKSEEKLRAAATLRARSFYTYPEGRSPEALKVHQKMKSDDEWATLTRKVDGLEQGFERTTCVIASCPCSEVLGTDTDIHDLLKVSVSSHAEDQLVVGTLDLNHGLLLPGELPGDHPQGPDAKNRRAYLSNVCTAREVRRRGVGMVLIQYAKKNAKQWGVTDLYVHVVVENLAARKIYEKAGFQYEKEESERDARSLCRPRRYLLRAQL